MAESLPRRTTARLIVIDEGGHSSPRPDNPHVPEDILEALTIKNQDGPFGQFLLQDPPPDEYQRKHEAWLRRFLKMTREEREQHIKQGGTLATPRAYATASVDCTAWHDFVLAPPPYQDSRIGRNPMGADSVPSGQVAQWIYLSRLLEWDLRTLWWDNNFPDEWSGKLVREVRPGDVIVGLMEGHSLLGANVLDENPRLTLAGVVSVFWALVFRRLNNMYLAAQGRAVLPLSAAFIANRLRSALDWDQRDLELLHSVRGELIANAALWTPVQARPARFWSDDGTEIAWGGNTYWFDHAAATIMVALIRAAIHGDQGVENHKLASAVRSESKPYRPRLAFRRKKGEKLLPGTGLLIDFQRARTRLKPDVALAIRRAAQG